MEKIKGGYGDNRPDSQFNLGQLNKGIKVEMEHTTNPKIAKEITKDHLMEDPKYYDHLESMERKAERHSRVYIRSKDAAKFKPGEFNPAQALLVAYYGSRAKARRLNVPLFRHNGKLWQGGNPRRKHPIMYVGVLAYKWRNGGYRPAPELNR